MTSSSVEYARIIQVIEVKTIIGDGTKENPVRVLFQYWDVKGNMLATYDSLEDSNSAASSAISS